MRTKLFTLFVALICTIQAFAYDAEIDGVYYNFSNDEATVTKGNDYSGSIVIPESVTYNGITYNVVAITDGAFCNSSELTSVTIPQCITTIGGGLFGQCPNLTSIIIEDAHPLYYSEGNCIINKRTKQLICGCENSIIPTDGSVISIGDGAFRNYSYLTSIIIPEGISFIGAHAFADCSSLTAITIPSSLTEIGAEAFRECSALDKVNYTGTLQSWCNISMKNSMSSNPLYNGADFYLNDIKVTDVIFDFTPENKFVGCTSLQTIRFTDDVKSSSRVPIIFSGCTNLQNILLPNDFGIIYKNAFEGCTSLKDIVIPSGVSSIKQNAFGGCTTLESATIKRATPPTISSDAFPVNTKIIVPCSSTEAYWADPEWAKYLNYEEAFLIDWSVISENENYGTVLVAKSPTACDDNMATFAAIAASGYKFKAWNDGHTDNPRTVAITEEITYTAHFINESNVDGVSLEATQLNLHAGETYQLTATITPATALNKNVTWTSTNENVASVSTTGLVTAHNSGSTNITVTTADGGFTATCQVNVSVPITSITLDQMALTLVPYKAQQLTATVLPENASNKNYIWQSSNEEVAIVVNGLVVTLAEGTTTITATTEDGGLTAMCEVTVTTVTGISLDKTSLELSVGSTEQLTETINATEASYQLVNWVTSDANVATVENGLVTAVGAGVAAIGVATADGGFVATCAVTVKASEPATEVQQVQANPSGVQKVLVDGVLYIVKPNGEKYFVDGRKVE